MGRRSTIQTERLVFLIPAVGDDSPVPGFTIDFDSTRLIKHQKRTVSGSRAKLAVPALADISSVEATVDKNPVMVDEAVRLTVVAEGDADRDAFDSSPLLKNFVVGRTSVSTQTSIINFDARQTTTWTTTLFPRETGTFTIPALTIEDKQTSPIQVKVIPVLQGSNQQARDYYVTTEVDIADVYLNQQIHYVVKLHLATSIERGSLQAPEMKNAQIKQIGDDKQYSDIVNGKRYQVIERQFAIVPQQSGEFTIRGPVFSGEVIAANTNQRFGFFNRTREVSRVGPDITVNVKPVPDNIDYHWLPSEFVQINEEWSEEQSFTVGEPVTRTVTLSAMGVVEEQLPEFPQNYPPNFKRYPDQVNTTTVEKDNMLIAQRVESMALIPTKAGKYVLPDITIPWFNVLTGDTEYAKIPARTITVAPSSANRSNSATEPGEIKQKSSETDEDEADEAIPSPPAGVSGIAGHPLLTWIFLALWLLTLAGWIATLIYHRKKRPAQPASTHATAPTEKQAYDNLSRVLQSGSPGEILVSLQRWLTWVLPKDIKRPGDYAPTAPLQPHIDSLLASQYSHNATQWDKSALTTAINTVRQSWRADSRNKSALPSLYR